MWVLPEAADLPPLVGAPHRQDEPMPGPVGLRSGTPGGGSYPPLAVPPGPPDSTDSADLDQRFERRLWWLTSLLLVVALLLTVLSFRPGPAWAEMPDGDALLRVDRGRVAATMGGDRVPLPAGQERYLTEGDHLDVPDRSSARITFPGGAVVLLCGGARLTVGSLDAGSGRKRAPAGKIDLQEGRVLADTTSTSGAYAPLRLTLIRTQGNVLNDGAAWFSAEPSSLTVATGVVTAGGISTPATGAALRCGDGEPVVPPASSAPATTEESFPTLLPTPSTSLPVVPSVTAPTQTTTRPPVVIPAPTRRPTRPTAAPTQTVTTRPTTTRPPTTTPPTTRPTTTSAPTPTTDPTTTTAPTPTEGNPTPTATGSSSG